MSLSLPAANSPLREMFEVSQLVNFKSLPLLGDALCSCRKVVEQQGVRSAQAVAFRSNGDLILFKVGKRGGFKMLWNFGRPF